MRELNIVNSSQVALVDDEDHETLQGFRWYLVGGKPNHRYVGRFSYSSITKRSRIIYLHRQIKECPKGLQVDHKNMDRLDCRRTNLRICTRNENNVHMKKYHHVKSNPLRRSVYRGVSKRMSGSFEAKITVNKKNIYIGVFSREHHAAMAYDIAARDVNGEFASLNFPPCPSPR